MNEMEKKENINFKIDPNIIKQRERKKNINFKIDPNIIRHFEPSILYSLQQEPELNEFIFNLFKNASDFAFSEKIKNINDELKDSQFYNIFPGSHYRILNGIVKYLNPKLVVEIGTYTGMGTFALSQNLSGEIISFDVVDYKNFETHLSDQFLKKNKFKQYLSDLSEKTEYDKHYELLNNADIIFIDAPKDGKFEYKILENMTNLKNKENKILILDDIKFMNMINLWNSIKSPKMDIVSVGNWTGTGLVDISKGLVLNNKTQPITSQN